MENRKTTFVVLMDRVFKSGAGLEKKRRLGPNAHHDFVAILKLALEYSSRQTFGLAAFGRQLANLRRLWYVTNMQSANPNADDIIATLRANEESLRAHGVMHAALFGSRARGDARPGSDILIDTAPEAISDVYDYVGIKLLIEDLFTLHTDVINRAFLKPTIRPVAERHLIYAF